MGVSPSGHGTFRTEKSFDVAYLTGENVSYYARFCNILYHLYSIGSMITTMHSFLVGRIVSGRKSTSPMTVRSKYFQAT